MQAQSDMPPVIFVTPSPILVPGTPSNLLFTEYHDFSKYLPYELRIIKLQKRGTSEACCETWEAQTEFQAKDPHFALS